MSGNYHNNRPYLSGVFHLRGDCRLDGYDADVKFLHERSFSNCQVDELLAMDFEKSCAQAESERPFICEVCGMRVRDEAGVYDCCQRQIDESVYETPSLQDVAAYKAMLEAGETSSEIWSRLRLTSFRLKNTRQAAVAEIVNERGFTGNEYDNYRKALRKRVRGCLNSGS